MSSLTQQLHYVIEVAPALAVALVLGTAIGWERYRRHRAPTVSTFIVLAAASCLAVRAVVIFGHSGTISDWNLPAAILTGVGFCGGAFIIWRDSSLEGVTTGMTVFFTAVIGILCGLGLYAPAALGVGLTLGVMAISCKKWPGSDDARTRNDGDDDRSSNTTRGD